MVGMGLDMDHSLAEAVLYILQVDRLCGGASHKNKEDFLTRNLSSNLLRSGMELHAARYLPSRWILVAALLPALTK